MKSLRFYLAQKLCRVLPPIAAQRLRNIIYPEALAYRDDREFVAAAVTGSLLKNRTSDHQGYRFAVNGYFDWRNWAIAMAFAGPGSTIIEVGANVGTETVGFGDIVHPGGRVFAFEPNPSVRFQLEETLQMNQAHHIHVLPYAVGDQCHAIHFCVPLSKRCSGLGHIASEYPANNMSQEVITVDCVTLDSLQYLLGVPSIVFIDTEGAEVMILRGGREIFRKQRPPIVLEASPTLLPRAGFQLTDLVKELDTLDYDFWEISRFGLRRIHLQTFEGQANWLCVPRIEGRKMNLTRARRMMKLCSLLPCIWGLNPLSRPSKRQRDSVT